MGRIAGWIDFILIISRPSRQTFILCRLFKLFIQNLFDVRNIFERFLIFLSSICISAAAPTPDELKAFFKKHDWSASRSSREVSMVGIGSLSL